MDDGSWPSELLGPLRGDQARRVREFLGELYAEAYIATARVVDEELSDGRGGEDLHEAAGDFLHQLLLRVETGV